MPSSLCPPPSPSDWRIDVYEAPLLESRRSVTLTTQVSRSTLGITPSPCSDLTLSSQSRSRAPATHTHVDFAPVQSSPYAWYRPSLQALAVPVAGLGHGHSLGSGLPSQPGRALLLPGALVDGPGRVHWTDRELTGQDPCHRLRPSPSIPSEAPLPCQPIISVPKPLPHGNSIPTPSPQP